MGGRKWELDSGQGKTAATARGGGVPERRGELDSARIWEGSGQGGRERALRELKRKERTEGAGRWRRGARHGTARRRRGGSAFNLDVRAVDGDAWRGRDASGRNRGRRGLGTQRVAGQVADAGGERRHGEKTERRWR